MLDLEVFFTEKKFLPLLKARFISRWQKIWAISRCHEKDYLSGHQVLQMDEFWMRENNTESVNLACVTISKAGFITETYLQKIYYKDRQRLS